MRKVLSLLLCVALLCSLVVITAQADEIPTADFANATTVPGGSVTINMNIANNTGLVGLRLSITDNDGLGAEFAGENASSILSFTANDAGGKYVWDGVATNETATTFGTLTITVPDDAETGEYTFTVVADQGMYCIAPGNNQKVTLGGTTFTITVTDKAITGVNVAIDAGLAIGVHVQAADIDGVSITAVDTEGKYYQTVEDHEEDEENGGYIFYLNVNPWAMDKEFYVDFTENFAIDEGTALLDTNAIPATAKTTGILSYCNAVLAGASDELKQLIADLLAYGQAAQTYQGEAVMDLPAGLTPTEAAWEDGNGDPCDFGTYCSENFPADLTGKNATAKKKFKFVSATIEYGSKFVVTFAIGPNGTNTAIANARIKVDGGSAETFTSTGANTGTYTYAFSPAQYAGAQFDLYAASSTSGTNFAWINNYGPAHYAAYVYGENDSAPILDVLEAFYLYGASVEAYVGSLGE